jgi:hypothetical protein
MTVLVVFVVLAVLISLAVTLAAGWIVIIPAFLALAVLAWVAAGFVLGRTPSNVVRRTRRRELLDPGGPDDPELGRR